MERFHRRSRIRIKGERRIHIFRRERVGGDMEYWQDLESLDFPN